MPRFHPQVRRDVSTAIRHYDSISDAPLHSSDQIGLWGFK